MQVTPFSRCAFRLLLRVIISIGLVRTIAACGGHSEASLGEMAFVGGIAADVSGARKRALAVEDGITPDAVLDWAEYKFPAYFTRGPASLVLTHEGRSYTVRAYPHADGTRYLGITLEGEIYGLGDFTRGQLLRLGVTSDFANRVTTDRCRVYPGSCAFTGALSLRGTVATGAALAGATVYLNCAEGSVTGRAAPVASDGTYSITVNDAKLPCVAKAATQDDRMQLHAVLDPSGGSAQTLNINPLTELIVARLTGAPPLFVWSALSSPGAANIATTATMSPAGIAGAIDATVAALRNWGYPDFSLLGDPMSAQFLARTATAEGNGYDRLLDDLNARMTGFQTTLPELTQSVLTDHYVAALATMESSVGTLRVNGGNTYALRALKFIDITGQVRGGGYNFYTDVGSNSPCMPSPANAATCLGAQDNFTVGSQSGPLAVNGAATTTRLQAGPDSNGYHFVGTIIGTTWSGTFTKVATASSPGTSSGTFSVDVKFVVTWLSPGP